MARARLLAFFVAMASAAWGAACGPSTPATSSGAGAAGPSACFDYAGFDATTPTVSFKTDVLPIFRQSCGLSTSCHGTLGSPGPYLGPKLSDPEPSADDIDQIFAANVGVPASAEPGMSIVAPGEPRESFMMHKLDGTLECEQLACAVDGSCGDSMPVGVALEQGRRDTIRRWIAQGAKND
jgi:hypothetical protein